MELQVYGKVLDVGPLRTMLRQGEHLSDTVTISMERTYNGLDRAALTWRMRAYTEKETLAEEPLPAQAAPERVTLLWEVSGAYTQQDGPMHLELIGSRGDVVSVIAAEDVTVWPDAARAYAPPPDVWQTAMNRVQEGVAQSGQNADAALAAQRAAEAARDGAGQSAASALASKESAAASAALLAGEAERAKTEADRAKTEADRAAEIAGGDLTLKADKVSGGTAGHMAGLDASGNLTDSGVAVAEVVQSWVVPCTGTYDAGTKTHRVRRDHANQGVGERFVAAVMFDRDYAQGDTVLFEGAQVTLAYDNAPDTAVASGAFRAGIVKLLNFQKMDRGGNRRYLVSITNGDAASLGGRSPAAYVQAQPNLLVNTDYRYPVNQRGQTSYSGKQYTLDMLYSGLDAGSVTVGNGCVTLGANAWYCWPLEDRRYAGVPLTLAVQLADGTLITGTATYPPETSDATAYSFAANNKMGLAVQRHYTEGSLRVVIHVYGEAVSITRVKLEVGEMFTGFTPAAPATELVRCQRYFEAIGGLIFVEPLPVAPRVGMVREGTYRVRKRIPPRIIWDGKVYDGDGVKVIGTGTPRYGTVDAFKMVTFDFDPQVGNVYTIKGVVADANL